MKNGVKLGCLMVFGGFFLFLFLQFSKVWIYFDDYGYLSLSYNYTQPGVTGSQFTIGQLLSYLKGHYFSANGRILYTGLFPLCYHLGGLRMVQTVMAASVFAVYLLAAALVAVQLKEEKNQNVFQGIKPVLWGSFICLLYGSICLGVQNAGTYWFAASFTYVLPACFSFLFFVLYYYGETLNLWGKLGCVVCAFLAAFSQEQWICAVFGFYLLVFICRWVKTKKLKLFDLAVAAGGILGALPILTSPAVAVRMNYHADFLALSLPERVIRNISRIIRLFFSSQNEPFVFLLLFSMFVLSLYLLKCRAPDGKYRTISLFFHGVFLIATLAVSLVLFQHSHVLYRWLESYPEYFVWVLFAYVLLMSWQLVAFLHRRNRDFLAFVYLAAVISLACLTIVPELPSRVLLPFIFLSVPVLGYMAAVLVFEEGNYFACLGITVCFALFSVSNLTTIYQGYAANYTVALRNDQVLKESASRIQAGEEQKEIFLERLPEDTCRNLMPYDANQEYMVYWMYNYYQIPEEVSLNYQDVQEAGGGNE